MMRNPVLSWLAFAVGFGAIFFLGIATAGESYVTGRMASGNSVPIYFEDVDGKTRAYVRPAVGKPIVLKPDNPVRLSALVDAQGNIRGTATRNALVPAETGWKGANRIATIDDIKIPRASAVAAAKTAARLFGAAGLVLGVVEGLEALDAYFDEETQTWMVMQPGATLPAEPIYRVGSTSLCTHCTAQGVRPVFGQMGTASELQAAHDDWVPGGLTCFSHTSVPVWQRSTFSVDGFRSRCENTGLFYAGQAQTLIQYQLEGCPAGYTFRQSEGDCASDPTAAPATDQELETRIATYFDQNPFDVWESVQQSGVDVEIPDDAEATLTPTVPTMETQPVTRTTTITNPDGSTTERVESTHQRLTIGSQGSTMANNTITYNVTNITTITENGEVVEHSETTVDQPEAPPAPAPAPEPEDIAFSDAEFPEIPELYEQKYPDGLSGVWAEKGPQLQQTAFIAAINELIPNLGGGSCPVWSMSFDMGFASYGTHQLDVPCWIFQSIGIVMLIGATFTAWYIIWG